MQPQHVATITIEYPPSGACNARFMRGELELLARELEARFGRSATVTLAISEATPAETPAASA